MSTERERAAYAYGYRLGRRHVRARRRAAALATLVVLAVLTAALSALLGTWHAATVAGWPPLPAGALSAAACGLTAGCGVRLANRWAARR